MTQTKWKAIRFRKSFRLLIGLITIFFCSNRAAAQCAGSYVITITECGMWDEGYYEIRNASNAVVYSSSVSGTYVATGTGQDVGPFTFYISTQGFFNDNCADYSVSISGVNVVSGNIGGGTTYTSSTFCATNTWTGASGTDWHSTGNWSAGILPGTGTSVVIPSGTPQAPDLSGTNAAVAFLTLQSAQTLTLGSANLSVSKNLSIDGTVAATSGKLVLNGTSAQTLTGNGTVTNLQLNNSAGAAIASGSNEITVTGLLSLTAGTLTTNDNLTLKSTSATSTAMVGPVTGGISGKVSYERYLSAPSNGSSGRSWRLLTAPLMGATNNSVYDTWQNAGSVDGSGLEIWGPAGSGSGGNGLATGLAASLRTYDASANTYVAVTDTKNETLFDASGNKAFLAFVTGAYGSGNISSGAAATNADVQGTLITGTRNYNFTPPSASATFFLIGNPYACPIDFDKVYAHSTNISRKFYTVDPALNNIGGYVTVAWDGISAYSITPASAQNQYIQNGQAFFVEAASVAPAVVQIQEADKETAASQTPLFRTNGGQMETFRIDLYKVAGGDTNMIDGALINGHQQLSPALGDGDALKFPNFNEGISVLSNGKKLAIEGRPLLDDGDSVLIWLSSMQQSGYEIRIAPASFNAPGLTCTLHDTYQNISVPVSLSANTIYPFAVTQDPNSSASTRFKLSFANTTPLSVTFVSVRAERREGVQLDWTVSAAEGIYVYEVERSSDGLTFQKIGSVYATGGTGYSFHDASYDDAGYYRIKAMHRGKVAAYSKVVSVAAIRAGRGIKVSPNPVRGDRVHIDLPGNSGPLEISVINALGQQVISQSTGAQNLVSSLDLDVSALPVGIYQIRISGTAGVIIEGIKLVRQ